MNFNISRMKKVWLPKAFFAGKRRQLNLKQTDKNRFECFIVRSASIFDTPKSK